MIKSCDRCGGLYTTETNEMYAGMPCQCPPRQLGASASALSTTEPEHGQASVLESSPAAPSQTEQEIRKDLQRHVRPWYDTDIAHLLKVIDELRAAPSAVAARPDGGMTEAQLSRAALIAESRRIDLATAQELVYLRDLHESTVAGLTPAEKVFDECIEIARTHDCTHSSGYRCYEGDVIALKLEAAKARAAADSPTPTPQADAELVALLDDLDAEYAGRSQHGDLVGNVKAAIHYALLFLGNWPRLSQELRKRLKGD